MVVQDDGRTRPRDEDDRGGGGRRFILIHSFESSDLGSRRLKASFVSRFYPYQGLSYVSRSSSLVSRSYVSSLAKVIKSTSIQSQASTLRIKSIYVGCQLDQEVQYSSPSSPLENSSLRSLGKAFLNPCL